MVPEMRLRGKRMRQSRFETGKELQLTNRLIEQLKRRNKGTYPNTIYHTGSRFQHTDGVRYEWVSRLQGYKKGKPNYTTGISEIT